MFVIVSEIMDNRPFGKPIEIKFHVIELSLLPPNPQGMMPAGIQRFPFEFLLPGVLPVSISIPERLDIFYQLIATLRRSTEETRSNSNSHWFDWARIGKKSKLTATAGLRLVRAIDSTASIPASDVQLSEQATNPQQRRSSDSDSYQVGDFFPEEYTGLSLDEQYDRLAYSLAGRSVDNFCRPAHKVPHGVRYKLGIDRTAIAIGTSLGIEIVLEPQQQDVKIRSILTKITENRHYTLKIPEDYGYSRGKPETRKDTETVAMILKWAYGYPVDHEEASKCSKLLSKKYHRIKKDDIIGTTLEEPSSPVHSVSKEKQALKDLFNTSTYATSKDQHQLSPEDEFSNELQNLKELDEPVQVGERFEGCFVLPVPTCRHLLRPSMSYDSISITHWLELAVTLEQPDGKHLKVYLETPVRLLDCRLVAADDERQTLLPPPPSYDGSVKRLSASDTFWEQRLALTQDSLWGHCNDCPCKARSQKNNSNAKTQQQQQQQHSLKSSSPKSSPTSSPSRPPLSASPEWGPPPSYSENWWLISCIVLVCLHF